MRYLTPKTKLGKWSVRLIIAFFLLFGLFQLLVATGQRGGNTFFSNPLLSIEGLLMATSGICAFFTGVFGIIKSKERTIAVFLATALGLLVLLLMLGEIFFEH